MREQDMRMRALRFLKARMRNMIMPAAVGIGLTVGAACESAAVYSALMPGTRDAGADAFVQRDSATPDLPISPGDTAGPDQRQPGPEAQPDLAQEAFAKDVPSVDSSDAMASPDAFIDAAPQDALADQAGPLDMPGRFDSPSEGPWTKYGSPDSYGNRDSSGSYDASPIDTFLVKYSAPSLDSGPLDSAMVRYHAPMPGTAEEKVGVLYAPASSES